MSRKSPSGVTDQITNPAFVTDVSTLTAAPYLVAPLFFAILSGSTLILKTDPSIPSLLLLNGSEITPGRIGSARMFALFPPGSSGDPVKVQFTVNGVAVGNEIEIPWVAGTVPSSKARSSTSATSSGKAATSSSPR
jgi:hypothetical protein